MGRMWHRGPGGSSCVPARDNATRRMKFLRYPGDYRSKKPYMSRNEEFFDVLSSRSVDRRASPRSPAAHKSRLPMSDIHLRSTRALKRDVSAGEGRLFTTLARLWPYIWPSDRPDLKARVTLAMWLLLLAKLAPISVPFTLKWGTDALSRHGTAPVAPDSWLAWALAA